MAENREKLFDQFAPVSTETWKAKVVADLKGADFDKKLVWRTNEGFNVQPMYRAEDIVEIRDTVKLNHKTILVCERITEDLIPVLRIIDGVISESGSDLQEENLKLVNPNLVYIQNVPDACKILEDNLSVSIDGEQGLIYEGAIC